MANRLPQLTGRTLIWLAGVALIAVGILCLYLSHAVEPTGSWWQGTLDAFGVGFVIAGIVDVAGISALNRATAELENRQQEALKGYADLMTRREQGYGQFLETARLALRNIDQLRLAYAAGTPDIPDVEEALSQTATLETNLRNAFEIVLLLGSVNEIRRGRIVCAKVHDCAAFFPIGRASRPGLR